MYKPLSDADVAFYEANEMLTSARIAMQLRYANALAAAVQAAKKLDADWHAVMDSDFPVAEFNAQIGRLHDEIQAQRAKIDQALAAYLGEGPDSEGS